MKADILLDHEDKWVALDKNRTRVIYSDKSLGSLLKRLNGKEKEDVILHYVRPFNGTFSL